MRWDVRDSKLDILISQIKYVSPNAIALRIIHC